MLIILSLKAFRSGGRTCVYIDSLAPYGELKWVSEQRATKLWLSWLPINEYTPLEEEPKEIDYMVLYNYIISNGKVIANNTSVIGNSNIKLTAHKNTYEVSVDCIYETEVEALLNSSFSFSKDNNVVGIVFSVGGTETPTQTGTATFYADKYSGQLKFDKYYNTPYNAMVRYKGNDKIWAGDIEKCDYLDIQVTSSGIPSLNELVGVEYYANFPEILYEINAYIESLNCGVDISALGVSY